MQLWIMSRSSLSSSLVDVNSPRPRSSGFVVMLPAVLKHYEAEKEEENENVVRFSFLLGKHRDRHLNIVVMKLFFYPNNIRFTTSFSQ